MTNNVKLQLTCSDVGGEESFQWSGDVEKVRDYLSEHAQTNNLFVSGLPFVVQNFLDQISLPDCPKKWKEWKCIKIVCDNTNTDFFIDDEEVNRIPRFFVKCYSVIINILREDEEITVKNVVEANQKADSAMLEQLDVYIYFIKSLYKKKPVYGLSHSPDENRWSVTVSLYRESEKRTTLVNSFPLPEWIAKDNMQVINYLLTKIN